jgi:hypothetical protein
LKHRVKYKNKHNGLKDISCKGREDPDMNQRGHMNANPTEPKFAGADSFGRRSPLIHIREFSPYAL